MIKNKKLLVALLFIFAASGAFAQTAQEAAPAKQDSGAYDKTRPDLQYSEADRPEDNYLERFHALETVERLMQDNLDQIFVLNVITKNFKAQHSDWDTDYNKVYEGYKEGVDLYYRRNIIYSRVKLDANKKNIADFYSKIADTYKKDCIDLLALCADNILQLTLDANTSSDPNKNRLLFNNKMRIRVAYGQMDAAERAMMDKVPTQAVNYYRVAKSYAIAILEELNPQQYKGKYDVHKADNMNRIMSEKKTTAPVDEVGSVKQ